MKLAAGSLYPEPHTTSPSLICLRQTLSTPKVLHHHPLKNQILQNFKTGEKMYKLHKIVHSYFKSHTSLRMETKIEVGMAGQDTRPLSLPSLETRGVPCQRVRSLDVNIMRG